MGVEVVEIAPPSSAAALRGLQAAGLIDPSALVAAMNASRDTDLERLLEDGAGVAAAAAATATVADAAAAAAADGVDPADPRTPPPPPALRLPAVEPSSMADTVVESLPRRSQQRGVDGDKAGASAARAADETAPGGRDGGPGAVDAARQPRRGARDLPDTNLRPRWDGC